MNTITENGVFGMLIIDISCSSLPVFWNMCKVQGVPNVNTNKKYGPWAFQNIKNY